MNGRQPTSEVPHRISLMLNRSGYDGADVEAALPSFMSARKTEVGLTWQPSAEGPNSFFLLVEVALVADLVARGFLTALSKDLYDWTKSKLRDVLAPRPTPVGRVTVRFRDVELSYIAELDDIEPLAELFSMLPLLCAQVESERAPAWVIHRDAAGDWTIQPEDSQKPD